MNINIVSVGKVKEKYIREGIKEFSKRLSSYCELKIIEIPDEKAPENLSEKEENIIKNREGERIIKKLARNSYIIPLVINGKQETSTGLSDRINKLMIDGISDITFIIGGSLGLSKEVIELGDFKLSFSKLTFPHQIMRLILLEQIYRSFRIIRGEPYHK